MVHQIKEAKTFTPKEGSFLDDFLKQINSQIQQVYETDKDVIKHIQQKLNNEGKITCIPTNNSNLSRTIS